MRESDFSNTHMKELNELVYDAYEWVKKPGLVPRSAGIHKVVTDALELFSEFGKEETLPPRTYNLYLKACDIINDIRYQEGVQKRAAEVDGVIERPGKMRKLESQKSRKRKDSSPALRR
jgi:hypothetical protein